MSKTKKANRISVILMLILGAAFGTVALALYVKLTPQKPDVRPSEPDLSVRAKPEPSAPGTVQVLIPEATSADHPSFGSKRISVPSTGDAKIDSVNAFLADSKLVDSSVKAMNLDVEDGIAALNFSEGFDSGSGSSDEATLIYGLRAVLGQFSEIQKFRILVEGKHIEELGHIEFGDTLDTIPVSRWSDPGSKDESPPPSMPR